MKPPPSFQAQHPRLHSKKFAHGGIGCPFLLARHEVRAPHGRLETRRGPDGGRRIRRAPDSDAPRRRRVGRADPVHRPSGSPGRCARGAPRPFAAAMLPKEALLRGLFRELSPGPNNPPKITAPRWLAPQRVVDPAASVPPNNEPCMRRPSTYTAGVPEILSFSPSARSASTRAWPRLARRTRRTWPCRGRSCGRTPQVGVLQRGLVCEHDIVHLPEFTLLHPPRRWRSPRPSTAGCRQREMLVDQLDLAPGLIDACRRAGASCRQCVHSKSANTTPSPSRPDRRGPAGPRC